MPSSPPPNPQRSLRESTSAIRQLEVARGRDRRTITAGDGDRDAVTSSREIREIERNRVAADAADDRTRIDPAHPQRTVALRDPDSLEGAAEESMIGSFDGDGHARTVPDISGTI